MLATQASPRLQRGRLANCFITRESVFQLMDVSDTTAHEPQLVGPRGLCRLAPLPCQPSPFVATPRPAGSSSHATRFTVNERAAAVQAGLDLHKVSDNFVACNGYACVAAVGCWGPGRFVSFAPRQIR